MSAFKRIGLAALGAVVLVAAIEGLLAGSPPEDRFWYNTSVRIVLYALAAIASAMAANKFGWWREYFGRAWTLFFAEFAFLLVNYIVRRTAPDADLVLDATLIGANICQIGAFWLMARSLKAAGLEYYGSKLNKVLVVLAALAIAILLVHSALLLEWNSLMAGEFDPARLISILADVGTFALVAPLLLSTVALHGGQLFWIFGFLTISVFGWMVNQGGSEIALLLRSSNAVGAVRTTGVAIACVFAMAAAFTQWLAADRAARGVQVDA